MNTHRMNITLPNDLAKRLRQVPNKSAFIAQALREKLSAAEEQQKKRQLAQAYSAAAKETASTQDWESVTGDGWE